MGMAASQARYLEITARKTNVEYQGQQINQQRTELANESAGLFAQLMGLQVPTAPSSTDYTTTSYTFNDGANNNTITSVRAKTGDPNYNATVTYNYTTKQYTGVAQTRTDLGVKNEGVAPAVAYWLTDGAATNPVNQVKLTHCSTTDADYAKDVQALTQVVTNNPTSTMASTTNGFDPANPTTTIGNVYKYTNANGTTIYYTGTDLAAASTVTPIGSATSLTGYYASDISKTITQTSDAYLKTAESGRYSAITLKSTSGTFDLSATTSTDENAYNDAVNEYTYQQQLYQQQVTSINAKTSIIQQEDRGLELQLKQLDTEQQALSTEMDSVKKVIDKNIEQTFKTFSS